MRLAQCGIIIEECGEHNFQGGGRITGSRTNGCKVGIERKDMKDDVMEQRREIKKKPPNFKGKIVKRRTTNRCVHLTAKACHPIPIPKCSLESCPRFTCPSLRTKRNILSFQEVKK